MIINTNKMFFIVSQVHPEPYVKSKPEDFLSSLELFYHCFITVLVAYISTGQIMGWGNKAIEIRAADTGHLDGVFMHKKAQKLKFLCERNDKVGFSLINLHRSSTLA